MNTYFFVYPKAQIALRGHLRQVSKDLFVLTKDGEVREKLLHRKGGLFKSYLGGTPIARNITLAFEKQCIDQAMTEGLMVHRKIALNATYEPFRARRNEFYDASVYERAIVGDNSIFGKFGNMPYNPIFDVYANTLKSLAKERTRTFTGKAKVYLNVAGKGWRELNGPNVHDVAAGTFDICTATGQLTLTGYMSCSRNGAMEICKSPLRTNNPVQVIRVKAIWHNKINKVVAHDESRKPVALPTSITLIGWSDAELRNAQTGHVDYVPVKHPLAQFAESFSETTASKKPNVTFNVKGVKPDVEDTSKLIEHYIGHNIAAIADALGIAQSQLRGESWSAAKAAHAMRKADAAKLKVPSQGAATMEIKSVPDDYKHLYSILMGAFDQATSGKGKERHAGGQPFEAQPMQSISDLFDSPHGMTFQVAKKVHEALTALDGNLEAQERELLGAINYTAGIILWLRRKAGKV